MAAEEAAGECEEERASPSSRIDTKVRELSRFRFDFDRISSIVGVFIAKGREDALVTRNLVPGESVYGEKRISVEGEASRRHFEILGFLASAFFLFFIGRRQDRVSRLESVSIEIGCGNCWRN